MSDRYMVVGNPIEHSLSPFIHQAFARQMRKDLIYSKELVSLGGFFEFAREFQHCNGKGMNVTLPFKLDAFQFADEHSDLARNAQSVNTLSFQEGRCRGHNTDGLGLVRDLTSRHGVRLKGCRLLLLGAGGGAQGVLGPLLGECPARLVVANRSAEKAEALVAKFASQAQRQGVSMSAAGLDGLDENPNIIINATSVGTNPASVCGDLFNTVKVTGTFCYDMSYGKLALFKTWAKQNGAATSVDGLGMLVEQAAEAFNIWHGARPQTEPVLCAVRDHGGGS